MIQEHALRKIEYCLHHYCVTKDIEPIILNILTAAERGYSAGTYMVRGHFVLAPVESLDVRMQTSLEEVFWPFVSEAQAKRFLFLVNQYFQVRGVRSEVLGIEGYCVR